MPRYRSYRGPRRPRTKKLRPLVRIKERVATKGGKCAACKGRYEKGADVTVVITKKRTYHRGTCVPANVGIPTAAGPMGNQPTDVVAALNSHWSIGEARLVAVMALENAMVVTAKAKGANITPEMEKSYDRFMKLKAMALRPGSQNEGDQATRMALVEIIKTFF